MYYVYRQSRAAVGWQQLERIIAAEHISDLTAITADQCKAISHACSTLVSGTDSSQIWGAEQMEQLGLLLRAAGHAMALYTADYDAYEERRDSTDDSSVSYITPDAVPLLTQLLSHVSNAVEQRFLFSSDAELQRSAVDVSVATAQLRADVMTVLQPALPDINRQVDLTGTPPPGQCTVSLPDCPVALLAALCTQHSLLPQP
jgi:hypothetical protein